MGVELRDPVDAREIARHVAGMHRRPDSGQIRTDIALDLDTARKNASLLIEGKGGFRPTVPPMLVGDHAAAAVIAPFDGPPEPPRSQQKRRVLRIGRPFHAERSAHIVRQDMHLLALDAHDIGEAAGQTENALARCMQRIAAGLRIELRHRGTRFHGGDMHAVTPQA